MSAQSEKCRDDERARNYHSFSYCIYWIVIIVFCHSTVMIAITFFARLFGSFFFIVVWMAKGRHYKVNIIRRGLLAFYGNCLFLGFAIKNFILFFQYYIDFRVFIGLGSLVCCCCRLGSQSKRTKQTSCGHPKKIQNPCYPLTSSNNHQPMPVFQTYKA